VIDQTGIVVAFYIIGATTVVSALMVAAVRNLIHAVLFLVLTFVGVAGIYIVLSADFVAMAQILIYAGAISVLLVFAVMLTPTADRKNSETAFQAPAFVTVYVIYDTNWQLASRAEFTTTAASLGQAFLKPYVVPFEVASVLLVAAMVGAIVLTQETQDEAAA
jgi:NADH:ubiquinone oxidoreductase subunit 6 (subunit J)